MTMLVRDLAQFAQVNEVYSSFFSEPFPARATLEVSGLPRDALVEIEAVFALPGSAPAAMKDMTDE